MSNIAADILDNIESFDGFALPYRGWLPDKGVRSVLLAVHGFNDYSNFCQPLVTQAREHGIAVYAYDQRGFGETAELGRWHGEARMVADLVLFSHFLRERHPDIPLTLLGESMGGAIVLLAEAQSELLGGGTGRYTKGLSADRLVLSAPAVWPRNQHAWYQQTALYWMRSFFPEFRFPCQILKPLGFRDDKIVERMREDPLVLQNCRVDTLAAVIELMDSAWNCADKVKRPTLLLQGGEDDIIPARLVEDFWARMPRHSRQNYLFYPRGRHMLMRGASGPDVIADIVEWVSEEKVQTFSSRDREVNRAPSSQGRPEVKVSLDISI